MNSFRAVHDRRSDNTAGAGIHFPAPALRWANESRATAAPEIARCFWCCGSPARVTDGRHERSHFPASKALSGVGELERLTLLGGAISPSTSTIRQKATKAQLHTRTPKRVTDPKKSSRAPAARASAAMRMRRTSPSSSSAPTSRCGIPMTRWKSPSERASSRRSGDGSRCCSPLSARVARSRSPRWR